VKLKNVFIAVGRNLIMRDAVTSLIRKYDVTGRYLDRDAIDEEVPELIRAGGNAYTTRRYSACLRDMDYYLRYASYALVAADTNVLDERVLQGLRETYNSLGVPIGPTVRGIQIMSEMIQTMAAEAGIADTSLIAEPFDHLTRELSEVSI